MEVAYYLVCKTTVPRDEISEGLGFRSRVLFCKWFKWRLGRTPRGLRQASRSARALPEGSNGSPGDARRVSEAWPTQWDWDRLVLGAVTPEAVIWILRLLEAKFPQLAQDAPLDRPSESS